MIDFSKYLDIPFSEADCYNLGKLLYKDIKGIDLPLLSYDISDVSSTAMAVVYGDKNFFKKVEKSELRLLDGIVFYSPTCGRHIGFYIGDGKFIHQVKDNYPAIERLSSGRWSKRILGYYRYES